MKTLTPSQQRAMLRKHLPHRLTLLRTLRERARAGESYCERGDIYRCVKDANLIAVRLLLDFMGLKGVTGLAGPELQPSPRRSGRKYEDDVRIDQFRGALLTPKDVPRRLHRRLAGVYCRADKELAHLTTKFSARYNSEAALIRAADAVESLLERHLYRPARLPLPAIDR
jgi:hypothetical protein